MSLRFKSKLSVIFLNALLLINGQNLGLANDNAADRETDLKVEGAAQGKNRSLPVASDPTKFSVNKYDERGRKIDHVGYYEETVPDGGKVSYQTIAHTAYYQGQDLNSEGVLDVECYGRKQRPAIVWSREFYRPERDYFFKPGSAELFLTAKIEFDRLAVRMNNQAAQEIGGPVALLHSFYLSDERDLSSAEDLELAVQKVQVLKEYMEERGINFQCDDLFNITMESMIFTGFKNKIQHMAGADDVKAGQDMYFSSGMPMGEYISLKSPISFSEFERLYKEAEAKSPVQGHERHILIDGASHDHVRVLAVLPDQGYGEQAAHIYFEDGIRDPRFQPKQVDLVCEDPSKHSFDVLVDKDCKKVGVRLTKDGFGNERLALEVDGCVIAHVLAQDKNGVHFDPRTLDIGAVLEESGEGISFEFTPISQNQDRFEVNIESGCFAQLGHFYGASDFYHKAISIGL